MYDPFASAPPPGVVNTTSIPPVMYPGGNPGGAPLPGTPAPGIPATNNALAAIYARYMPGQTPPMIPGYGGMPNVQFPLTPAAGGIPGLPSGAPGGFGAGGFGGGFGANNFDWNGFHQAKMDWRAQRPDQFTYDPNSTENRQAQQADWRSGFQDWRDLRPNRRTWVPATPATGA